MQLRREEEARRKEEERQYQAKLREMQQIEKEK